MWIYIINFVLIIAYGIFIKNKKLYVSLAAAQTFLILALRAPTLGVDLDNYSAGFEFISGLDLADLVSRLNLIKTAELVYPFDYESGYAVANWIVGKMGFDFHGFLVIHAAFCMFSAGRFIYKYCDDPKVGFALFLSMGFFQYLFGILRQTLALAILLFAIPLIKKKKPIPYILICLLAFTVHRVSLILVPLYFICQIRLTKKRYIITLAGEVALLALSPVIAKFVLEPLLHLIGKTRYTLQFNMNMQIIIIALIAVMILIFAPFDKIYEESDQNMLCWMFLLALAIQIIGMYNDVVARAVYIPYIAIVALIPNVLERYRHPGLAWVGKIALCSLTLLFMIYQIHGSVITPYVTFLA